MVGLVDFSLGDDPDVSLRVAETSGYSVFGGGHGAAVSSLLVAAHDGRGVMGIAPGARLALGNPFDDTLTASWEDVTQSLKAVLNAGGPIAQSASGYRTSVVNLSIGVKGSTFHQDWLGVYSSLAGLSGSKADLTNTVFVHGAGNDGVSQSGKISWSGDLSPSFVVVGSVGPSGQISSFSNRPGDACLTTAANSDACGLYLKTRFLVAPGEWILTSDGIGGVARHSGTSFAAPMVTGAVSLIHSNWGWLKDHPRSTLDILFKSATDLGEAGVDEVYGQGLLNIAAAMAPLDVASLKTINPARSGAERFLNARWNGRTAGGLWSSDDAYFVAYESLDPGGDIVSSGGAFRDFRVPLAAKLADTTRVFDAPDIGLLSYMVDASVGLMNPRSVSLVSEGLGIDVRARVSPHPVGYQVRDGELPYRTGIDVTTSEGLSVHLGSGNGAAALSGAPLTSVTRFDPRQGGLNPILGLASGGAYATVGAQVSDRVRVSYGIAQRTYDPIIVTPVSPQEIRLFDGIEPYSATASHIGIATNLTPTVSLEAGYTRLDEVQGVMGVRSLDPSVLDDRSTTDAITLQGSWSLSSRIKLTGAATGARSREQNLSNAAIGVGAEGILSSSFEVSLEADRILRSGDRARLALLQPLHVESGWLRSTGVEVLDRDTGELGVASRTFALDSRDRRLVIEAAYSATILDGAGQVSAFMRNELSPSAQSEMYPRSLVGAAFSVGF
jgi:hypothetical protein